LNQLLRDGFDNGKKEQCKFYGEEFTQFVKNMESALMSDELKTINNKSYPQFFVYRGINSPALGEHLEQNGSIHHPHYMSTSINKSVAQNSFGGNCCTYCIIVNPRDDNCPNFCYISLKKDGTSGSEQEVLFEKNCYLNFERKNEDGTYVVTVSRERGECPKPKKNTSTNVKSNSRDLSSLITQEVVDDEFSYLSDDQSAFEINILANLIFDSLKVAFPFLEETNAGIKNAEIKNEAIKIEAIGVIIGHIEKIREEKGIKTTGGNRKKSLKNTKKHSK
jgi:hypothetical protein